MQIIVADDYEALSVMVTELIAKVVERKPDAAIVLPAVLGPHCYLSPEKVSAILWLA